MNSLEFPIAIYKQFYTFIEAEVNTLRKKNWANLTHLISLASIDSLTKNWVIETLILTQQDSQCESC